MRFHSVLVYRAAVKIIIKIQFNCHFCGQYLKISVDYYHMKKVFSYSQNCIIAEISDSVMKKVTITIRNEALDAVFRCTNQEAPVRLKWFFEQIIIYRFNYYKSYVQLVTIFHFKKFPCTFLWVILHKEIFTTLEFVWARFFKAQSLTFFCWKFTSLSFSLLKVFPNWIQILPCGGKILAHSKHPEDQLHIITIS